MMGFVAVFVSAGVGGALRHGVNLWVAHRLGTHFPWHTFTVNVAGSLLMGLLAGWFVSRGLAMYGDLGLLLGAGVLGGFTTFSAFSLDVALLWERPGRWLAALYIVGSVAGAIAGLVLGFWVMRTALA
ncbi:MAG: fluoride efflux transporter CrcB [Alphaproteobacteria bacterium]|nr:fluoride efflux transporter CrcB [Alphaproteobacteria bacterium]